MSNDANRNSPSIPPTSNPFADNFAALPVENANPYAAPATRLDPLASGTDEMVRLAHINHEASLRGFGILFILGGSLGLLLAILAGTYGLAGIRVASPSEFVVLVLVCSFYGISGIASLVTGIGLRRLNRAGKIGGTILGSIGLLAIPLGTIINAYLLYLIWSEKGQRVFTEDYQRIRLATPRIQPKTPLIAWIVLFGFVFLTLVLIFLAAS